MLTGDTWSPGLGQAQVGQTDPSWRWWALCLSSMTCHREGPAARSREKEVTVVCPKF